MKPPYSPADLTEIRESFDLTGPQFARLLSRPGSEIHRNTWRKWERGEQDMPAAAQNLVAMLLFLRDHKSKTMLLDWWEGCP